MRAATIREPLSLGEAAAIKVPDASGRLQSLALIAGVAGLPDLTVRVA